MGGESEGSVTAGEDRVALYTYVYVGCLYIPTDVHTYMVEHTYIEVVYYSTGVRKELE